MPRLTFTQNSDNGYNKPGLLYKLLGLGSKGGTATPSNVTRLCRALQPSPRSLYAEGATQDQPMPLQIVNYEPGIGSTNNFLFVLHPFPLSIHPLHH